VSKRDRTFSTFDWNLRYALSLIGWSSKHVRIRTEEVEEGKEEEREAAPPPNWFLFDDTGDPLPELAGDAD
jgi:hypothetical protein